ncbi:MAG: hypothetical protein PWQ29_898 [Verrucomicrobiota bacterium]|jgi:hypothetical protein|nr:hypothetical protein [Verrucomicrobiota bacterium]MDK2963504.1 hypothetical protein [Verrucomicrobiota bacterium]
MMKNFMILSAAMLLGAAVAADDRAQVLKFDEVEISEPGTPLYQDSDGNDTIQIDGIDLASSDEKKWFRIAAKYETRPKWLDRLTIEYYVLMPTPENTKILFKGVVNYVDIPKGREHRSEMYMHFNSYARYHKKREEVQYAVLARIDDKIVAIKTNGTGEEWWTKYPVHSCGLLNRLDTPFRAVNAEQYEAQDVCTGS